MTDKDYPIDFTSLTDVDSKKRQEAQDARIAMQRLRESMGSGSNTSNQTLPIAVQNDPVTDAETTPESSPIRPQHPLKGATPVGGTCADCKFGVRVIAKENLAASLGTRMMHCFGHPPVPVIVPTPQGLQTQITQLMVTDKHWCPTFFPRTEAWPLAWMMTKLHHVNHEMLDRTAQSMTAQDQQFSRLLVVMQDIARELTELKTRIDAAVAQQIDDSEGI